MRYTISTLVLSVTFATTCAEVKDPPDVVLIFADDLGYGDVGCFYDKSSCKTPNLDRMAAEGAKLTSSYVPTPYCAPSRATILTGRYPFRHGVVRNPAPDVGLSNFGLDPSEITIAELLKECGYSTAAFGKWHLGHKKPWLPRSQGFDEYVGILYSNDMYPVQMVRNEQVIEYPVVQSNLSRRYTDLTIELQSWLIYSQRFSILDTRNESENSSSHRPDDRARSLLVRTQRQCGLSGSTPTASADG